MNALQTPIQLEPEPPESIRQVLHACDVEIGGSRPWDVHIHNPAVYRAVLRGDLDELGNAYVRGDWDCDRIDQLVERLANADPEANHPTLRWLADLLSTQFKDGGSRKGAKKVGHEHYDIGNDVFEAMLDPTMTYSCGYWAHAGSLKSAQADKLDLICRKLGLSPGMKFLDVGGGWGGLSIHAARHYGVEATMITVSQNQFDEAMNRSKGLPVTVLLQDYRDTVGSYDRIASVGMFEHVGAKHYHDYMTKVKGLLNPSGLFLLHCIGSNTATHRTNPWIDSTIFPGGHIPTAVELTQAIEGQWVMEDWHNFGPDYDLTLMEWYRNFEREWPRLRGQHRESFYRQWRLYLMGCAGAFRARQLQLWQVILSPSGVPGGYIPVR